MAENGPEWEFLVKTNGPKLEGPYGRVYDEHVMTRATTGYNQDGELVVVPVSGMMT